jgi:hypothetical protein
MLGPKDGGSKKALAQEVAARLLFLPGAGCQGGAQALQAQSNPLQILKAQQENPSRLPPRLWQIRLAASVPDLF